MQSPKLEDQLCFALYRASRAIIRSYGPILEDMDLTYLQYLTMLVLWEHGTLSVGEIGEHLILDSATLTPLLKKLEAKALISRIRDKRDERTVRVSLTKSGEILRKKAAKIPQLMSENLGVNLASHKLRTESTKLRDQLKSMASELEANQRK